MQFKVPQFLDIEDTIFGPFTFKQFVYLAGGAGLCFVIYKLFGFLLGFIPMALVAGFACALAFYRPNGKPFINMVQAAFGYAVGDKLYIWKRRKIKKKSKAELEKERIKMVRPKVEEGGRLTSSKLRSLAWSLDVLDQQKLKESGE